MIKFNDNGVLTSYIKSLLDEFNLPTISVVSDIIIKDRLYIYGNKIIKSKVTKEVTSQLKEDVDYSVISFYVYNRKYPNLTKNLKRSSALYDSYTHRYLGNYLRFLRDYKKLDLMSLYNCFSNEICNSLSLKYNLGNTEYEFSTDSKHIVYMIPVKFFKEYTIAFNSSVPVEMLVGFYSDHQIFTEDDYRSWINSTYKKVNSCNFNNPIKYNKLSINSFKNGTTILTPDSKLLQQENNLRLFIKVPITFKSAIVVLEGSYSNDLAVVDSNIYPSKEISGNTLVVKDKESPKSEVLTQVNNNIQLLRRSFEISHPFADRLIEYILGTAITPLSEIEANIARTQEQLEKKSLINNKSLYTPVAWGKWNENIKHALYKYSEDKGVLDTKFDVLGFVDKDVENALGNYYEQLKEEANSGEYYHAI